MLENQEISVASTYEINDCSEDIFIQDEYYTLKGYVTGYDFLNISKDMYSNLDEFGNFDGLITNLTVKLDFETLGLLVAFALDDDCEEVLEGFDTSILKKIKTVVDNMLED